MKHLAVVGLVFLCALAQADVTGKWVGGAILGPSKIAQTLDGDQLLKLHNSKEFMKTLVYEIKFGADKSLVSIIRGEGMKERKGKGTWKQEGAALTITLTEENGAKRAKTLLGTVSPDGTRFVVTIPSKPGLPITKLIFKKVG